MSANSRTAVRNAVLVASCVSIASLAIDARATDVSIDPRDSYLRAESGDGAGDTPAIQG